jgi:hypothetical protein
VVNVVSVYLDSTEKYGWGYFYFLGKENYFLVNIFILDMVREENHHTGNLEY